MSAVTPPLDPRGMQAARRYARWHIGDGHWADLIIQAYLNPDETFAQLDAEQVDAG